MAVQGGSGILSTSIRWMARGTGLFFIGMIVIFMVGEGVPPIFEQPSAVQVELIALALMLVGYMVGWRWEGVGGVLSLGGYATFSSTELLVNSRLPGGLIPILCIPGVLFLVSYLLNKHPHAVEEDCQSVERATAPQDS